MLAKRIIPCLDVNQGRVVKGVNFLDLRDAGDPSEVAARYDEEGADELVFLDITASAEGRGIMLEVVRRTAEQVFMPLTVGGGIRCLGDVEELLRAGADKVSLNTAAVQQPELIRDAARRFGRQCLVVAVDAKRYEGGGEVADGVGHGRWQVFTHGGRRPANLDVMDWVRQAVELGAGEILLTSMDRDGTRDGYDLELTRAVSGAVTVPVIASGGAGNLQHLYEGLTKGLADAVLAASIFHYQEYTIRQAKAFLQERGVPIRMMPEGRRGHD